MALSVAARKVIGSNETGPIKAAGEVGIECTKDYEYPKKDYTGAKQDVIGMTKAGILGGRRMSTTFCYLEPARGRPNLAIQTDALTECLPTARASSARDLNSTSASGALSGSASRNCY